MELEDFVYTFTLLYVCETYDDLFWLCELYNNILLIIWFILVMRADTTNKYYFK